ncbi:STAS domain-containing protein [Solirubrobacter ginsenosidimutans]|uniref:STAS domain-containing protein n=1 Tax=Solirubrobacter ginsenosidimutans TaxID=490573 RepID=A0A9X3N295_9ACTN|nr:STAS domain-containing protein [Solirubrobacter ginsenosidimutans]MDA0167331.1 STAS domain-containing protein [Solirubrobacter ginsenosidimutans]
MRPVDGLDSAVRPWQACRPRATVDAKATERPRKTGRPRFDGVVARLVGWLALLPARGIVLVEGAIEGSPGEADGQLDVTSRFWRTTRSGVPMSDDSSSDDSQGEEPAFLCSWHPEAIAAASVMVSGELNRTTAPRLDAVLREALDHARLVLLNLHDADGPDAAAWRVIIRASVRARKAGSRLLVAGATPHAAALSEAARVVEFIATDHALAGADASPHDDDVDPRIRPLDNPVNARVLAARVMVVTAPDLWLLGTNGAVLRAWRPPSEGPMVPGAASIEVYLDDEGAVNGWRNPDTGLAINQRRVDRGEYPLTASNVPCQGNCGVVWLAPAAERLIEHDERCLTCAGPLVLA